jgi:hypothetical protein
MKVTPKYCKHRGKRTLYCGEYYCNNCFSQGIKIKMMKGGKLL